MKKRARKWICAGLCVVLTGMTLTGCSSTEESTTEIMGRVTAISDGEITLAVFNDQQGGERPDRLDGERPEGTPPADGNFEAGKGPDDGENPEGTPPADRKPEDGKEPQGDMPQGKPDGGELPEGVSGGAIGGGKEQDTESRTIKIGKSTKLYEQQGDETTEVSLENLPIGSMVSVTLSGDEAKSITIQTMRGNGNRGDGPRGDGNRGGEEAKQS